MNNSRIIYLIVWLYVLPFMYLSQQDAMASDTTRWGVTTNKKLEKDPNASIDRTGLEANQAQPNRKDLTSTAGESEKPSDAVINSAGAAMKSDQTKHPNKTTAHDNGLKNQSSPSHKANMGGKKMKPAAKDTKIVPKTMAWVDEHQKMTCQKYLTDLKKSFLDTRHYSIQGASCQTKEFAAAFLKAKDKCIKDCPQGFLGQNGYTDRIIRNITYLEKLGQDRCENKTDAPAMPQTN